MDNLTHALAGVLTAEVLVQARRRLGHEVTPAWGRAAWVVSAVAHNLPDLDLALTHLTVAPLGYLLHHRGHTHTLLAGLPLALGALGLGAWLGRREGWSRVDRGWLLAVALLGPLGHLALDLSNSYGIHPLWPLHDGWFYGDAIFIVEPLFWACTLPLVVAASRPRAVRVGAAALLAAGVLLAVGAGQVPWPFPLGVVALGAVSLAVALRAGEGRRAVFALGASVAVLASFVAGSRAADGAAREALQARYPGFTTLDVIRTPLPATPLCWQAIAVQRGPGDEYALRSLRVGLGPVSPTRCRVRPAGPGTAPLAAVEASGGPAAVEAELVAPRAALRALAARCDGAALLRFVRAPFVAAQPDGGAIAGDLRYDREPGPGFAEMRLSPAPGPCPARVAPWTPPRADLLAP